VEESGSDGAWGPVGGPGRGEESRGNPATWPLSGFSEILPGFAADNVRVLSTTFLCNRTFYGYFSIWRTVGSVERGLQVFSYLFTYSPPTKFHTHSLYRIVSFLVSTRFTCLRGYREDKIRNRI